MNWFKSRLKSVI